MSLKDRMSADDWIVFGADGRPRSPSGGPLPDDEILERLRKQGEEFRRALPPVGTAAPRPLRWRHSGEESDPSGA